jgi:serine/threonine protein kinase
MDYASPEVRAGAAFSAASDVYALGLLLYRLLTGKRPFTPNSAEPMSPRKLCSACPRGLDRLLLRMLSAAPDRRPALTMVRTTLDDEQAELAAERDADADGDPAPPPTAKSEPAIERTSDGPAAAAIVVDTVVTPVVTDGGVALPGVPAPQRRSRPLARLSALAITAFACFMVGRATVESPPSQLADASTSAPVHSPEIVADQAPTQPMPNTSVPVVENKDERDPAIAALEEDVASRVAGRGDSARRPTGQTLAARTTLKRRGTANPPAPSRGPTTSDEAQHVAGREAVLAALQQCANVPGTIIAELDIESGRGSVAMFNRHQPSGAVSWHACARTILEGLEFPASAVAGRVRVRLKLQ